MVDSLPTVLLYITLLLVESLNTEFSEFLRRRRSACAHKVECIKGAHFVVAEGKPLEHGRLSSLVCIAFFFYDIRNFF